LSILISGCNRADDATKSSANFKSIGGLPLTINLQVRIAFNSREWHFLNVSAVRISRLQSDRSELICDIFGRQLLAFAARRTPSNSSEARILMCASNASGVMTSSAGLSFSAGLSAAKREKAAMRRSETTKRAFFMLLL